jgi:DNA-binding NarL/FixJ family response regulator
MKTRIRVAIADDDARVRAALCRYLSQEPDLQLSGEAGDGLEALELVASVRVDVLILDLSMPRMNGWQALAALRRIAPATRVVVLSGEDSEGVRKRAFDEGAAAFADKGGGAEAVVRAVRAVMQDPA